LAPPLGLPAWGQGPKQKGKKRYPRWEGRGLAIHPVDDLKQGSGLVSS